MSPTIGSTLGGRYTLTERIATGGMGDVYAARDAVLHRIVAVKVMRPRADEETAFAMRFRDEARHTAGLSHPNIATVYDYGEDDGTAYLVMELVPGEPLSTIIGQGPMPVERVRTILGQCALALAAAHEAGVVHRDVKPANILVTPEGQVKLTDFGIARATDGSGHTRTGEVMGTPQYLAPEQALGRPVTGATDLYALGVVGFEMLTGKRPFDGDSAVATALSHINDAPPPLPEHVTDPLRAAIESCLAKEPAQRPASAASLAALLGMPVAGVHEASLATHVVPISDLGVTQAFPGPTPPRPAQGDATQVVPSPGAPAPVRAPSTAPPVVPVPVVAPVPIPEAAATAVLPAGAPSYTAYPPVPVEYDDDEYYDDEEDERRGRGWWWLVPIIVALLVGGFFYWQTRDSAPAKPTPTPSVTTPVTTTTSAAPTTTSAAPTTTSAAPTTTGVATKVIQESDYLGQQIGTVRQTLTALGFTKIRTVDAFSTEPKGTVLKVAPTGTVAIDAQITITVSKGPAPTTPPPSTPVTTPPPGGTTPGPTP
ncbi:MAG TPA: protein kinase [Dermatophilaceae bacterium]|jgi:tRNA A-37 threonylcarbamoyl transferase component Bud32|nr:protein kinase [Dermatophilaceae bacterium]